MGLWTWLLLIILTYGVYAPLSELLFHIWHIGTVYRGSNRIRQVALTFDDGPDETFTPQVLDILRDYGIKATFFLVAKRAEMHPELVERILAEGHEVASHSLRHKHAWLMDPISTWKDIRTSKLVLERLTGQRIVYYRPPWGAFNFVTRIASSVLSLRPVLWSNRAIDWLPGEYIDDIVERIVPHVLPGTIVLCHDAGGAPNAPLNMIGALPRVIEGLQKLGYKFATVREMDNTLQEAKRKSNPVKDYPFLRRSLVRIWSIVEWCFQKMYHVTSINEMFRTSRAKWHHGTRLDNDGVPVTTDGAPTLDIHFQNDTLIAMSSGNDNRGIVRALKLTKSGLKDFARILQNHPDYQDIETISAVTLMNRGIEMLGFHVEELPMTKEHRRLERYMRFLMGMYHPGGFKRLKEGTRSLSLKLIWMSRAELIRLYGDKEAAKESVTVH